MTGHSKLTQLVEIPLIAFGSLLVVIFAAHAALMLAGFWLAYVIFMWITEAVPKSKKSSSSEMADSISPPS